MPRGSSPNPPLSRPRCPIASKAMTPLPISKPDLPALARTVALASGAIRVYLFGSRARGAERPDSDVDLALVLPTGVDRNHATLSAQRAVWPRRVPLDLVPLTDTDFYEGRNVLARTVAHEGRLLYDRATES